jgi:NAD(P)-dependent dehydrogenase (short-subunit alcohol dehydrogenase family)
VALSREWARRLAGTGVAFHAMHPGWVDTPGIAAGAARLLWSRIESTEHLAVLSALGE